MKTNNAHCQKHAGERGLAVLVVIVILAVMTALAISNSRMLASLKRELQLIEAKQLKRAAANTITNSPPQKVSP